ncbi:3-oxoadipate enol-lactonase [Paenibacillus cellulosilyticus]|uniref:3-oxoadipate enol-lactonase n=1 Tax=Paenibacillus cellulosilyticus TaxID=375489 RepID=A0A2V2Z1L8_9BACL|nr:alpha/beta fold hydrolase [Paenibacillus cellulosilyticus]PWW02385.1 3-oxoadipate enol-lactonase [Paenibacillus cellulosilyticus]QKS47098.1 alpha/beta fold hydrolase [Paenibacillus cellulosilyticus]
MTTLNKTREIDGLNSFTTIDGVRIVYRIDGSSDKPILMLANSIATTMNMWDGQIAEFSKHFRVLRYDYRGHGGSDTPDGPYSFDRLGRDVIELLDVLHIEQVHFLGLSLGGVVGQWLGIYAPERVDRLVLSNTSSYLGPYEQWQGQITSVLQPDNLPQVADTFIKNWFPPHMLESENALVDSFRQMVLFTRPQGIAGSWAAIRDMDMRRTVSLIDSPTLVIAGQYDTVTLPSHGELIADTVPNASLVLMPSVHLPNIEYPDQFLRTVLAFLLSN